MNEPIFDHEKLGVYRVSIEDITRIRGVVKSLSGVLRPIRDQWMRAAQSIPLNIAEGNGKESLKDQNRFFEIARGSALECAAIHDVLDSCELIDSGMSPHGKTELKRVVSMLTRLIQRSDAVREDRIEYEYRDAEYEYEHETADEPEPSRAPEPGLRPFFHPDDFPSNDRLPRWIASLLSEDPSEWYLNGYCHRKCNSLPQCSRRVLAKIASHYQNARNSGCKDVIWSNEGLYLLNSDREYNRLVRLLAPHSEKVVAVCCFRDVDSFRRSYSLQLEKEGRMYSNHKNSYRYVREDSWLFDYDMKKEQLRNAFDETIVFSYDRQDNVGRFFEKIEYPVAGNTDYRHNVTT